MEMRVTGSLRQVAESAWISTLDEIKAKSRPDDDARRVVNYLIDNQHTSPLEAVTLSIDFSDKEQSLVAPYLSDKYIRLKKHRAVGWTTLSADLLNFIKITYHYQLFDQEPWALFAKIEPDLAEICQKYEPVGGKVLTEDVSSVLGEHQMRVDLISIHNEGDHHLSRATWRVLCPLSIAVQILRHRAGSYNMTSGRYRTLRQDIIAPVKDCSEIFTKMGLNLEQYLSIGEEVTKQYKQVMSQSFKMKEAGQISNQEYKRVREFARYILPEGRMTELYVTYYLDDFFSNYLPLRNSEHAQTEHIWIAQEMLKTLNNGMLDN